MGHKHIHTEDQLEKEILRLKLEANEMEKKMGIWSSSLVHQGPLELFRSFFRKKNEQPGEGNGQEKSGNFASRLNDRVTERFYDFVEKMLDKLFRR